MNNDKQQELAGLINEYFDGLEVDFSQNDTLDKLFQTVVDTEFEEIPTTLF